MAGRPIVHSRSWRGLAGSSLLFTGLIVAWVTAVLVIPRIKKIDAQHEFFTYPDFLRHRYNEKVALVAALISGVGYLGFTGGQLLAGALVSRRLDEIFAYRSQKLSELFGSERST